MKIKHIAVIEKDAGSRFWGTHGDTLAQNPGVVEIEPHGEFVRVRFLRRDHDLLVPRGALIIAVEREVEAKK